MEKPAEFIHGKRLDGQGAVVSNPFFSALFRYLSIFVFMPSDRLIGSGFSGPPGVAGRSTRVGKPA